MRLNNNMEDRTLAVPCEAVNPHTGEGKSSRCPRPLHHAPNSTYHAPHSTASLHVTPVTPTVFFLLHYICSNHTDKTHFFSSLYPYSNRNSITPSLHLSITPSLHHSISTSLHLYITPSLHLSINILLYYSITPSIHHSITPSLH